MKTNIIFSLLAGVLVSLISVRAEDNAAQAAARAALEQAFMGSGDSQTQTAPAKSPSVTADQSGESVTNTTDADIIDTILAGELIPQIAPTESDSAASPAVQTVAIVNPVVSVHAAPVVTTKPQPAAELAMSAPVVPAAPAPAPAAKKSLSRPAPAKTANEIATTDGTIFKNAEVEKVESDGIIVSYSSPGGGLGMSKVYFADLSAAVRQQYERK
jgi:hypothetical protein